MINENDSEDVGAASDSKLVLLKFPEPLLREMDALCRFNCIDRSEFIIFAAEQLLDYMERKIGVRGTLGIDPNDESHYELDDEAILEAAEDSDE